MSDEKLVNKIIDLELALIAAKDENAELKAKVAELEADINNNKGGIFAYDANGEAWVRLGFKIVKDSEANNMQADAILKVLDLEYSCETQTGDNAFSSTLIEDYADKVRRGES